MVDDGRRFCKDDRNRIEPDLVPGNTCFCGIAARCACDIPLFRYVDRSIGCTKVCGAAGFHLDKDNNVTIASYDVNLSLAAARAIVPGQNGEARPTKITVSVIFSPSSQSRFRSETAALTE